jgi:tetratricopeptide (TPR) repeat protein
MEAGRHAVLRGPGGCVNFVGEAGSSNLIECEMVLDRIVRRRSLQSRKADLVAPADRARDAGQWQLAAQLYRQVLARDPRDPAIWVQYGHALKESGGLRDPEKLAQAEAAYRRALLLEPGGADAYLHLGHVLKLQKKVDEAKASYLRAFALDPLLADPLEELGGLGWSDRELSELCEFVGIDRPEALKSAPSSGPDRAGSWESVVAAEGLDPEPPDGSGDMVFQGSDRASLPVLDNGELRARIEASGIFDPKAYLSLHEDVRRNGADAWEHFIDHGLNESRPFTNCEVVARRLAQMDSELTKGRIDFREAAQRILTGRDSAEIAGIFRHHGVRIGVFCSSEGNFFMHEIANLVAWGLQAEGVATVRRDENDSSDEPFALRVFVAPQEFFLLGRGAEWRDLACASNSVLYNIDQVQSPWFCRVFPLFLRTPLILDINFQSAAILRSAGCNVVHFMPGYLSSASYTQPCIDLSDVELAKGYAFGHQPHNWHQEDDLDDRPIDILFIGTSVPRRDEALTRLYQLSDLHRFLCIYTRQEIPLTERDHRANSTRINCALAQRAKIVLNIHRDWLGYFEWSRLVLQGFWQGACVVSEPNLPNPIFEAGQHYLEENPRHIGELIRWLLSTTEGRQKLDGTRIRGYEQSCGLGAMRVALAPVLGAFRQLLAL